MSAKIRAHTSSRYDNDFNSYLDDFLTYSFPTGGNEVSFSLVRSDFHTMKLSGLFEYNGTGTIENITGGTLTSMIFKSGLFSEETSFTVSGLNIDAVSMADAIIAKSSDQFFDLLGAIEFIGNQESDTFAGGDFADDLRGAGGADNLDGGAGDDTIAGGKGADRLIGGDGIDTLDYRLSGGAVSISLDPIATVQHGNHAEGDAVSGFENVIGSSFNDKLQGDGGINKLDGGRGNDVLIGGDGADQLTGGSGVDVLNGGGGADQLIGGSGTDEANYSDSNVGVSVNLGTGAGSGGHAQGDQLSGIENPKGSGFNDTLIGGILANSLAGSGGNDRLEGGAGKDNLDGGSGADVLIGGTGIDTIAGRSGADTFVLFNKTLSADVIRDFTAGADTLEIDAILFGGGLAAGVDLDAGAVEVNATGLASTDAVRFILNSVTGQLFFDINGSRGGEIGRHLIATLEGTQTGFSESDFAIV